MEAIETFRFKLDTGYVCDYYGSLHSSQYLLCQEDDVADFLDDGTSLEVNNFEAVAGEDGYATGKRDDITRYINMHC